MSNGSEGKNKIKKVASDLVYSIAALVLMNGVIQLVLYPYLNAQMGDANFGTVLSVLSVVSIMGSTFGTAANYSRMMATANRTHANGEYNIFLIVISALSVVVSAVTLIVFKSFSAILFTLLCVLMVVSILRYYADVQFRMTLNYKGFFVYYALIAVGYVVGVLVYRFSKSWTIAILPGELFAVMYVAFSGNIFKRPFLQRSEHFKENIHSMITLSGANFISALILNADRILINVFVGEIEVTTFYTATLIGKIIALLTTPINGVIIGYLSKYKGKFTRKFFAIIVGAVFVVGVVGTFACTGVSYVFVKIMYPNVFDSAKEFFILANAGQLFYFVSGSLMVVLMRFSEEKIQLYINTIYAILFAVIVIPSVIFFGLWGITIALVVVNVARLAIVAGFGFVKLKSTAE